MSVKDKLDLALKKDKDNQYVTNKTTCKLSPKN